MCGQDRRKPPLEMGVQKDSQETGGRQRLLPAPWPSKSLNPLYDQQTKTILQNNNSLTAHSELLLRFFFSGCSFEAEIKGSLPEFS